MRNVASRELLRPTPGSSVSFYRHTAPLEQVFADLVEDLTVGGWTIKDTKGSLYARAMAGCGSTCDELRFYAVTRRFGGVSETILRVTGPADIQPSVPLKGACEPVPISAETFDEASRYAPVYDVDLDRDGQLDVYVPRWNGSKVVWDARVMRGTCGHLVGTFPRLPADPHTSKLSSAVLVDLTVSLEVELDNGRRRKVPVTYSFDGSNYVAPDDAPAPS